MTELNIAVLGTGRIADTALAPALQKAQGARLWSVLSRDRQRATEFAQRHAAAAPDPAHIDLDAVLADPRLDAVIIATPDKLHAKQAIAAADAGKHVLVEKPMVTSSDEAAAMVAACERAGVTLAVAYHLRWHQGHRSLRQTIVDGKFGDPRHMRVQWSWFADNDNNWRAHQDVGRWWSLAGVGTHCLDLIRWFMGSQAGEISTVKCVIDRGVWQGQHDETAVLALQFDSGATAELCSSVLFQAPSRAEIYCRNGYAICQGTLGGHGAGSIVTGDGPYDFEVVDPYRGEIEDFVEAINRQRPPEVAGEEGARNVQLIEAAVSDANVR